MILLAEADINLIAAFASDVASLVECNCACPGCGGDCTHADALKILKRMEEGNNDQDTPEAEAYRKAAKSYQVDGEIEVDEGAIVSMGDDPGAYVQAWIWVTAKEAGLAKEEGENA